MNTLPKIPKPQEYEPKILDFWEDNEFFVTPKDRKQPYTILMPPPNVTSFLHMGHGTGYSLQDWIIRWRRMRDGVACWLPGLDHAGIATQMMVEKQLALENTSKHEIGRDAFVKRAKEWKNTYGGKILKQFRMMGFSCDFSKLSYTLDEQCSYAVRYAFVTLFEEGLIYRGYRLVNWDPLLMTALGDEEVVSKDIHGHLYTIRYNLQNQPESYIPVATTRPETMFGDVALAVHPEDTRYQEFIGSKVIIPLTNRAIPVIADDYVKPTFGTGALKITPAHDPNDYEIGKRHDLPSIIIFDDDAKLNEHAPKMFQGMDRFVARKELLSYLKAHDLFLSSTPHRYAAPHSDRSGALIEPKLCSQWYVKAKSLAAPVAQAARDNHITFYPTLWKKTWLYWLDNIQDWCISRQLWWGHRIPIWHCKDCKHTFPSLKDPSQCQSCGSENIYQDEDVLDTWFSSWLWPLSPFGWPKETHELERFYPSDVIITGPEIIFQWVARMVMAGIKFQGALPFKKVYFTTTVCDKQGRKFSKTLGNGIDPLDVIEEYGADALRYTAAHLSPTGGRIKMDKTDFALGRNFVTKLWNSARFLLTYATAKNQCIQPLKDVSLELWHKGLLHELYVATQATDLALQEFRVHEAHKILYQCIWNALCDWGIEASKPSLKDQTTPQITSQSQASLSVMLYVYECALRLVHPLTPFVTEELIKYFPQHPDLKRNKAMSVSVYPSQLQLPQFPEEHKLWQISKDMVSSIRRLIQTSTLRTSTAKEISTLCVWCYLQNPQSSITLNTPQHLALMAELSGVYKLEISETGKDMPACALVDVDMHFEIAIALNHNTHIREEIIMFEDKQKQVAGFLRGAEKKLANQGFVTKADPKVVQDVKNHKAKLQLQQQAIEKTIASLKASLKKSL